PDIDHKLFPSRILLSESKSPAHKAALFIGDVIVADGTFQAYVGIPRIICVIAQLRSGIPVTPVMVIAIPLEVPMRQSSIGQKANSISSTIFHPQIGNKK